MAKMTSGFKCATVTASQHCTKRVMAESGHEACLHFTSLQTIARKYLIYFQQRKLLLILCMCGKSSGGVTHLGALARSWTSQHKYNAPADGCCRKPSM